MGEVYRARDTKLGRDVALKLLSNTFATDLERRRRQTALERRRSRAVLHLAGSETDVGAGGIRPGNV
jgi:serine/threonine protein kinase